MGLNYHAQLEYFWNKQCSCVWYQEKLCKFLVLKYVLDCAMELLLFKLFQFEMIRDFLDTLELPQYSMEQYNTHNHAELVHTIS